MTDARKTFLIAGLALVLLVPIIAGAGSGSDGSALFAKMKCTKCHDPKVKKTGPALQTIAAAYKTPDNLVRYFQGKSEPIVEPARAKTMKPRRRKLARLKAEEQEALAAFILGFKK